VSSGGEFDHFLVLSNMVSARKRDPSPFKFNPIWMWEEDCVGLIKDEWVIYDEYLRESTSFQFTNNFKKIKQDFIA